VIDFALFRRLFQDSIRVQLNWDALDDPAVRAIVARSPQELTNWFTPWYRADHGSTTWDNPAATPIPVTEPGLLDREPVAALAAHMHEQRAPTVQVLAATYAVPQGQLILDGNHRIAGALGSGKRFAVLALSVEGPLDPKILPDLARFG
jgi:hypothetical protein